MEKNSQTSLAYKKVHVVTFWVTVALVITGNIIDMVAYNRKPPGFYIGNWITIVATVTFGLINYFSKKNLALWYFLVCYCVIANSWGQLLFNNGTIPDLVAFFLRETIIVAISLMCVALVSNKIHAVIIGSLYLVVLVYITYSTQNYFLKQNLVLLFVIFLVYTIFVYIFTELLQKALKELNKQNNLIKEWNVELHGTNTQLEEQQQFIEEQKEELETLLETVKQKNQELEAANHTKDKFFNIIAHDLRNPVGAIEGFAYILSNKEGSLDDTRRKSYTDIILKAAAQLKALLENLLQWARTQTGRIEPNLVVFPLNRAIGNAILSQESNMKQKQIVVNYEDTGYTAYADPMMIETVLRNLLSNAIKYSYRNSAIEIKTTKGYGVVSVSVTDSGIGMTEERVRKLLGSEIETSEVGTESEPGTGIGFLICKDFIRLNKGKIWIESYPSQGSTFSFEIPSNKED